MLVLLVVFLKAKNLVKIMYLKECIYIQVR